MATLWHVLPGWDLSKLKSLIKYSFHMKQKIQTLSKSTQRLNNARLLYIRNQYSQFLHEPPSLTL